MEDLVTVSLAVFQTLFQAVNVILAGCRSQLHAVALEVAVLIHCRSIDLEITFFGVGLIVPSQAQIACHLVEIDTHIEFVIIERCGSRLTAREILGNGPIGSILFTSTIPVIDAHSRCCAALHCHLEGLVHRNLDGDSFLVMAVIFQRLGRYDNPIIDAEHGHFVDTLILVLTCKGADSVAMLRIARTQVAPVLVLIG